MKPTYEQLLAEVEQLRRENEQLRVKLGLQPRIAEVNMPQLSLQEKVELFQSLFYGRNDVFARRWYSAKTGKCGYQPVCINEWQRGVCDKKKQPCAECPNRQFKALEYQDIYDHLAGKDEFGRDVVGLYPIREDNTVSFLCVDFDDKSCEHGYQDDVLAYVKVSKQWNMPCYIERSRSGNGAHVWTFFDGPITAADARRIGNAILTEAMMQRGQMSFKSYDRMFPNQNEVEKGGFGNLVALPMQGQARKNGNSVFVDETFESFSDQWSFLQSIDKISNVEVINFLRLHGGADNQLGPLSTSSATKPWETPQPSTILPTDFHSPIQIVRANMLHIPLADLSGKMVNYLKRLASFRNPEFYKKLAMRLSTHDTPRIITCAEVSEDYISLPRGCEKAVIELLDEHGVQYTIDDKTSKGEPINCEFMGQLRTDQQDAVSALLSQRNGILHATTAFGKTVAAIGLIAQRKVNTLILVHNKALLDQWKERLTTFLELDYKEELPVKRGRKKAFSPFGTLDSTGNSLHGKVDIALMQSCLDDNDSGVKPFVRDYGMVIIDECHHAPAVTFERVLRFINARWVYGLTATPIRKDGLQGIIYMQCGQIRYTSDAKQQIAAQTFNRYLVPRFTTYRNLSEEALKYVPLCRELSGDEPRNSLIVEDAIKAVEEGRTPIILTTLTEHVQQLSQMLCKKLTDTTIISLVGSEKAKEKREKMTQLQAVKPDEKLIVVATGKYVGEGFDYARLDTLMLAMPVSWKGLITQYAGRLHHDHAGKQDVKIYDYIDIHIPLADRMYCQRLKGYAEIGYTIESKALQRNETKESIFSSNTYFNAFLNDVRAAKKSIIISTPKIWLPRFAPMLEILQELQYHGITISVFTAAENDHTKRLQFCGIRVVITAKANISFAIIDSMLTWYGNVNYFAHTHTDEYALRLTENTICAELTSKLMDGNTIQHQRNQ